MQEVVCWSVWKAGRVCVPSSSHATGIEELGGITKLALLWRAKGASRMMVA